MQVRKFEGNPLHPASRGRNCAKGPATINQIQDPERILYPLRRAGARGEGKWERVRWDQVLDEIGGRIRSAFQEGRRTRSCTTWAGPGHERTMDRDPEGVGHRRPQLPHERLLVLRAARVRALVRVRPARAPTTPARGSSCCCLRTSSQATTSTPTPSASSRASWRGRSWPSWIPASPTPRPWRTSGCPRTPGSEAAVLLAMAHVLLEEGLADLDVPRALDQLAGVPGGPPSRPRRPRSRASWRP